MITIDALNHHSPHTALGRRLQFQVYLTEVAEIGPAFHDEDVALIVFST